jgi:hypothetical protein
MIISMNSFRSFFQVLIGNLLVLVTLPPFRILHLRLISCYPVYYKLFNEEELSKIRHPIYRNNPYIGRIDTTLIPPPHTVAALVERICKKEGKGFGIDWENDDAFSTVLFESITSRTQYGLDDSISLLGKDRPGSDPQNPVILKVGYKGMH